MKPRLRTDTPESTASSPEARLDRLVSEAVAVVPGCAAALAVVWRAGAAEILVSSHPDLPLVDAVGTGTADWPVRHAWATGAPVEIADTMRPGPWPNFTRLALAAGVRSMLIVPARTDSGALTLELCGLRPGLFEDGEAHALAWGLVRQASAALRADDEADKERATAANLRNALHTRPVIDQAVGVLMHARGCGAREAFEAMSAASQQANVRLVEIARRLVADPAAIDLPGG
ncbi:ANTAR domain-containing protein [Murinocardiopsis flavida]|uniref:ANTAR domain-containing protein n=1 Tax=Murinocardiopsis flavida TaxID=645275 RepID=A0A2P8D9A9_9ACTN|nr:ANTAR domain-containing protein [Murinocardiopsis flavida]PSK93793.1 ANTAR domain-containing protein [Murinocardiopsis flavida]